MPAVLMETVLRELQTGFYAFDLVNELGAGINKTEITSMTLTYYDKQTEIIINGRQAQNILDANNVTLTTVTSPALRTTVRWSLRPEDTIIINVAMELELHIALFQWTWGSVPVLHAAHEMAFYVENLLFVP